MKRTITILALLIILVFICTSCYTNSISFDIDSQSIITCNRKVISNLHIISNDSKDFYHFSKKPNKEGVNTFNLIILNHDYNLFGEFDMSLSFDSFKLRPETVYTIENSSFGDGSRGVIIIKTDKEGKVVFSDYTSCD